MDNILIRKGEKSDCISILKLISELGRFNGNQIGTSLTIKDIETDGFGERNFFKAFVAETIDSKRIIGYALYYYIYSSFEGRSMFLEDLYIIEEFRHLHVGESLISTVFKKALEIGCSRTDLAARKWNTPALNFYNKCGGFNPSPAYNFFRLEEENMIKLAESPKIIKNVSNNSQNKISLDNVIIRKGELKDCASILRNIVELSIYTRNPGAITINAKTLETDAFGDPKYFRILVAEDQTTEEKRIIGYALYCFAYMTESTGRKCFMEDLYVTEAYRHVGLGTTMWKSVIQDVLKYGCKCLDFEVVEWNTSSMKFYKKYGAINITEKDGLNLFRFGVDAMKNLSKQSNIRNFQPK